MQNNDNIIYVLKGLVVAGVPSNILEFIVSKAVRNHYGTEYQFWLTVMGTACKQGILTCADKLLGVKPPPDDFKDEEEFVEFLKAHPVDEYVKTALRLSHFWSLPPYEELEFEDGTAWPDVYRKAKIDSRYYHFRQGVRDKLQQKYLPWRDLYPTIDNPDQRQLEHYVNLFIADLEADLQKKAQK